MDTDGDYVFISKKTEMYVPVLAGAVRGVCDQRRDPSDCGAGDVRSIRAYRQAISACFIKKKIAS